MKCGNARSRISVVLEAGAVRRNRVPEKQAKRVVRLRPDIQQGGRGGTMTNRYGQDGRAQDGFGRDDAFQDDADDGFANRPSFMRGPAGHHAQPSAPPQSAGHADSQSASYESDPLAELARLIGQTDPFSNFGRSDAPAAKPPAARHFAREPLGRDHGHAQMHDHSVSHMEEPTFPLEQPAVQAAPQYEAPIFHPPTSRKAASQSASGYDAADFGRNDRGDDFNSAAYGAQEPQWGRHPADGRIGDDDAAPIPSFLTQPRDVGYAQHPQEQGQYARAQAPHAAAQGDDSSRYDPVLYGGAPHVPGQQQDAYAQDAYRGQDDEAAQGHYGQQGGYDPRYDNYDPNLVDPYGQPYDDQTGDTGGEQGRTRRSSGMITVAAILALAFIGTAGAYAYRSFMSPSRSGTPPIIKADTTPNKIVPPKKDGESGGKAIYDRVGGSGNSASATLVPREEAPVDVKSNTAAPRVVFPPLSQPNQPPSQASRQQPDGIAALAAASARTSSPADDSKKIRTVTIRPDQPAAAAPEPEPDPAPVPARPQSAARQRADTNAASAAASGGPININPQAGATRIANTQPVAPAPAPAASDIGGAGGYLVQISSQRSESDARNSYRALQGKFPSVLGSRNPVIKRADLGAKGVYYRAMVGPFDNSGDASQFCSDLKSAGGQCVIQRN